MLFDNTARSLGGAPVEIQRRHVDNCRQADPAYGAFQRGLYKTAYNLALPRAEQGDAAARVFSLSQGVVRIYKLLPDGRRHGNLPLTGDLGLSECHPGTFPG